MRATALTPGITVLLLLLLTATLTPATAAAQYFGRNKVQYQTFDWKVAQTESFDVHFYPEQRQVAMDGARMAERWNHRLQQVFGYQLSERKPFIFYANHPDFQQTNVVGGPISEGIGGLTESARNRVVLPFTGVYADNDHVIGHELVHVYQYDIAQTQRGAGVAAMARMPLWVIEGKAEYLSIGRVHPHTTMWMRDAALRERLPTMDQLTRDPRLFPYRYGHAVWAYIAGTRGDSTVVALYRAALRGGWNGAIRSVLGITADSLSREWIAASQAAFAPQMAGRTDPFEAGESVIISGEYDRNVSPSVSPDGNLVAFFSTRGIFQIDLYLADARTGRTVTRLTDPNRDPHFDAISFIASAGSWSPDGERLAFVVFARGNNEIAIWNINRRTIERTFNGGEVVEAVSTVAWSPDGNRIAYSGTSGGISNLYVYDLTTGRSEQLTDDRHAQLHPTWSPDGRTLAFATDQGAETDFRNLTYGPMRLALMDVDTREIRLLDIFQGAKHINPQYSPDGSSLYFISDRGGVSDVYRYEVATGSVSQVTRVATGVTGIAELSPALSVARETGRLLFSVFWGGREHILALEPEQAMGTPVTGPSDITVAGTLPPAAPQLAIVEPYLADAAGGLPPETEFPVENYRRRLGLEYIGPPQVGVAADQFGVALGGAAVFYFADMLGDHRAAIGVQALGTLRDIGGQLSYLNARRRLNWGGSLGRIPVVTGFTRVRPATENGIDGRLFEQVIQRVFVDQAQGVTHYPFSTTQRLELSASATRLSFHQEAEQLFVVGNQVLDHRRVRLPAPDPIAYGQGALALVGDWSFFGFTSPMAGGRYRLEVAPTFGSINFYSALVDYRRYLFFRPFTFAFRGLHFGRYGGGAEDERLNPLFVGFPTLIRGYQPESFRIAECSTDPAQTNSCPEFDRLIGSRVGVLNAELRIPLVGVGGVGLIQGGFLPIEIAPFFDAGVAWTRDEEPVLRWERETMERVPVFSAGVSTRVNLFNVFVLDLFYAIPFQRPQRSGVFGWQLAPGW